MNSEEKNILLLLVKQVSRLADAIEGFNDRVDLDNIELDNTIEALRAFEGEEH